MLTPQELIDMPGYGNAEKHLRAQGQWRATDTDAERIDFIATHVEKMRRADHSMDWHFSIECQDYDPDMFRYDLDAIASKTEMKKETQ